MRSAYFPPGRNRRRKLAMLPTSEKQQPIHSASQGPSSCHRWKLSATSAAPLVCPSRRAVATIPLAQEQQCTACGRDARSISVDVDESPYAAQLMARIRNAKRPAQSSAATTSNSCAARGVAGRFCSDNKTATRPAGTLTRKSQCHVATLRMADAIVGPKLSGAIRTSPANCRT